MGVKRALAAVVTPRRHYTADDVTPRVGDKQRECENDRAAVAVVRLSWEETEASAPIVKWAQQ